MSTMVLPVAELDDDEEPVSPPLPLVPVVKPLAPEPASSASEHA
jgi:hypothetical protein